MEISFSSNSTADDHIATTFGTCHDSPAVVPCAKYCSDHFISIWMRAKWNFHHIWIVMEKSLVKWVPEQEYRNQWVATFPNCFNSLWPSDAIWWKRSVSSLAQLLAFSTIPVKANTTRPQWLVSTGPTLVNIGSSNGLLPDGTKPLLEPMLTQIYVAMQRH